MEWSWPTEAVKFTFDEADDQTRYGTAPRRARVASFRCRDWSPMLCFAETATMETSRLALGPLSQITLALVDMLISNSISLPCHALGFTFHLHDSNRGIAMANE